MFINYFDVIGDPCLLFQFAVFVRKFLGVTLATLVQANLSSVFQGQTVSLLINLIGFTKIHRCRNDLFAGSRTWTCWQFSWLYLSWLTRNLIRTIEHLKKWNLLKALRCPMHSHYIGMFWVRRRLRVES